MKTFHTITPANVTISHVRVRFILALVGIVTAILCAITLMHDDVHAADLFQASVPHLLETPKIMFSDLVGAIKIWF
ncbi:hypothetical protein [Chryseolinea sp. H1M3-3]|uniref:hypothetical protein n=1 Tax=Chryseolinea sp. H1M3-3 TaxID=3034144 RepID=UPI0023EC0190|nr:hypothetical protein [Chryseolinea sp. H1M3-3]